jgi:two-component system, OmpR family, response regulator
VDELTHVDTKRPPLQNILLVDENPEHAALVKAALQQRGCQVIVARDGGQAHGSFEMQHPDFVITELIVRGESGFELCEWVKMKKASVPVLILTEIQLNSARALAAKVGADGYLTKPFNPQTLDDMVEDIGQVVWERTRPDAVKSADEQFRIHFTCRCGRKYRKKQSDAGRSIQCTGCNDRLMIPLISEMDRPDFRTSDTERRQVGPQKKSDPSMHIMLQCQSCATSFHLVSSAGSFNVVCPRCDHVQTGDMTMNKSQLSKAALTSCGRVFAVREGDRKGKKMLLPDQKVYFGRKSPSDILINSPEVSRKHCSIKPTPEGLRVKDSGSRTGTFVNGTKIEQPVWIKPGDLVKIGPMVIELLGTDLSEIESEVEVDIELRLDAPTSEQAAAVIRHHWSVISHAARSGDK